MQGQRMRSSGSRRRSSEGQSSVPLVDCYPSLSNLKCVRLARLLTLSSLTTPCTLTGLITCVSPVLGAALEQTRPERAQGRVVEARVGQLQPKQILPVDPRPHRLGRPPIGQVLTELQDGHQRQAPRWQGRPAELGKQVGKIRVGEDGAELVPQPEQGVALAEGSP